MAGANHLELAMLHWDIDVFVQVKKAMEGNNS